MKILESENKDNLQKLEKKIRKVANWNELKNAEMVYITEEKILYFDHSFVFRKVNKSQSPIFFCHKCCNVFKTQHALAHHMEKHKSSE